MYFINILYFFLINLQIYILAAKPSRTTTALFRTQMNNLNGPFLAFLFPEVECRTLPFEQAAYWIQHALLYIIPVYILRTGLYQIEDLRDFNWVLIGVEFQLLYHFSVLNIFSMVSVQFPLIISVKCLYLFIF